MYYKPVLVLYVCKLYKLDYKANEKVSCPTDVNHFLYYFSSESGECIWVTLSDVSKAKEWN